MRLLAVSVACFVLITSTVWGQEPPQPATSQENADAAAEFAAAEAKRYEIQLTGIRQPLVLEEKPLLRWSNPLHGEVYGSVMLWTRNRCPEAMTSIYRFFDRKQINAELVSLSESSLSAERSGKKRWQTEPGVKFAVLEGAPVPGDTAEKRQLQLRSLARKFSAQMAERDDDTKFSELRLMARPIYQYAASDRSGREGSVFAFVTTNDPEVLLILESVLDKDRRSWRYAAARLHYCALRLELNEKAVWEVPRLAPPWEHLRGPDGAYLILQWDTVDAAEADRG
jgi:hypothetical protein